MVSVWTKPNPLKGNHNRLIMAFATLVNMLSIRITSPNKKTNGVHNIRISDKTCVVKARSLETAIECIRTTITEIGQSTGRQCFELCKTKKCVRRKYNTYDGKRGHCPKFRKRLGAPCSYSGTGSEVISFQVFVLFLHELIFLHGQKQRSAVLLQSTRWLYEFIALKPVYVSEILNFSTSFVCLIMREGISIENLITEVGKELKYLSC